MTNTTQEQMADEQQRQLDNKLLRLIQQHFPSIPLHGEEADRNWTRWLNFARECSNLSTPPTKEGQGQTDHSEHPLDMVAQPSVVPMPKPAWWLNDTEVYETKQRDSENNVIIGQAPLYTADQMQSYATAKTAEAVREIWDVLNSILPLAEVSLTRPNLDLQIMDAKVVLNKYAPKKEQSNG